MDDNFRIQWTTIPHLLDESSASLDETSRRTQCKPLALAVSTRLNIVAFERAPLKEVEKR